MSLPKNTRLGGATISGSMFFDRLPPEITTRILSFLTETKDVLAARSVCKRWDLIVMNPRPVVARIGSPDDFVRLAKAFSPYSEDTIPFRLAGDTLFMATRVGHRSQHGEAQFLVKTDGFERDVPFSLPTMNLMRLLQGVDKPDGGERRDATLMLFERVNKLTLAVFFASKKWRLTTALAAKGAGWSTFPDCDYRLEIPFNAETTASLWGNMCSGKALITVLSAPVPEYMLHLDLLAKRLVVVTMEAGDNDPEIKYYFIEHEDGDGNGMIATEDGEMHALLQVNSTRIDKYATLDLQPLFQVSVGFELLWEICVRLRGKVNLCIRSGNYEKVPIVLRQEANGYKVTWAIPG